MAHLLSVVKTDEKKLSLCFLLLAEFRKKVIKIRDMLHILD